MIAQENKVQVVDHPLAQHLLTRLRAYQTAPHQFRRYALALSDFLVYEAAQTDERCARLASKHRSDQLKGSCTERLCNASLPVLRAGLIMAEAAQKTACPPLASIMSA